MASDSASAGHDLGGTAFHLGESDERATAEAAPAPIELSSLLRRCLDDRSFCGMILHKFAARSADQLAALDRALQSANVRELARQAHTLQGVAANLSAPALRRRALELEEAALRADLDAAGQSLVRTREEVARCVDIVPELIELVASGG